MMVASGSFLDGPIYLEDVVDIAMFMAETKRTPAPQDWIQKMVIDREAEAMKAAIGSLF
jgi:hypothetical protein